MFTCMSKRQSTVAAPTTEAEYIGSAQATKEALWLRLLLNDLGVLFKPFPAMADNPSPLKLLKNPVMSCARSSSACSTALQGSVWQGGTWTSATSGQMRCWRICSFTKPIPGSKLQMCCDGIGCCACRVCVGVLKDMLAMSLSRQICSQQQNFCRSSVSKAAAAADGHVIGDYSWIMIRSSVPPSFSSFGQVLTEIWHEQFCCFCVDTGQHWLCALICTHAD